MALRSRSGTPRAELSTLSESELLVRAREHPVPRHVAIIMDGNGRWATRRGLPRVAGHREGVKAARAAVRAGTEIRSEEHTSELQSLTNLVCRLLLEKKKKKRDNKEEASGE